VVENLDKRFEAPGPPGAVGSLEDPKTTLFPGGYGRRATYRFDFSDQHVLARTLGAGRAATRLCFDSVAATRLLAVLKKTGALRVLSHQWAREALVAFLGRLHFGSDGFAVAAEAEGKAGRHSCSVWGRGEGRATGVVAALVAEILYDSPPQYPGVFHIDQLFDPLEFFASVAGHGISFELGHAS
jgi:hypothetical protein